MSNGAARFAVSKEIFELFPGLRLPVAVAEGVEAGQHRGIEELWRRSWEEASREGSVYANAQAHPRVSAWRAAMGAVGVSGRRFPSSIESLLRRAMKGGESFSINPLADFYNAVSLRHVVPAGGFDLGALKQPLELRLTQKGDHFHPLDGPSSEPAEPGEVAYTAGSEILTRHFVWKQSRTGLLHESTHSVFLVSEVLGEVESFGGGVAEAVLEDFAEGLRYHFGAAPKTFLVEEDNPEASWRPMRPGPRAS